MRVVGFALVLAGVLAAVSPAQAPVQASGLAMVVAGSIGAQGDALAIDSGTDRATVDDLSLPGVSVSAGESLVRVTPLKGGRVRVKSVSAARTVSLLDGLVTAYGVRRTVIEDGESTTRSGRVDGLRIGGEEIGDVAEPRSFDLPDHSGRVVVNHGTIGVRVLLTRESYGHAAGTDLRIAVVRAEVKPGAVDELRSELEPTPTATPRAPKAKRAKPSTRERRTRTASARLTRAGYAFPVFGDASIADDFGAPRQIGAHQGNDVFAPFGAPVLAVADGTVEKVGTLPISGNRLWLRSAAGDEFFYAHLSAFAPAAVDGARVEAGTVLGFIGNTGDAEPTPPHVHFEIHPGGRDAIDPHAILLAWQGRGDVDSSAWLQQYGADTAERPGALVEVRDFIAGE